MSGQLVVVLVSGICKRDWLANQLNPHRLVEHPDSQFSIKYLERRQYFVVTEHCNNSCFRERTDIIFIATGVRVCLSGECQYINHINKSIACCLQRAPWHETILSISLNLNRLCCDSCEVYVWRSAQCKGSRPGRGSRSLLLLLAWPGWLWSLVRASR